MSSPAAAFTSFSAVTDPARHGEYNAWHQLDHRPENLLLPGVMAGERFVHSPACKAVSLGAVAPFADIHYVTFYWFRPPVADSIARWSELAEASFQWGRRPELGWISRPFMSFFRPVIGLAAPRIGVSAEAVLLRPCRGIHLTVLRVDTRAEHRARLEPRFRWYRETGLPEFLRRDGVAGVWSLSSDSSLAPASWARREHRHADDEAAASEYRIHVLFLDDDPVEVSRALAHDGGADLLLAPGLSDLEDVVFSGPLETITPWRWEWFDQASA